MSEPTVHRSMPNSTVALSSAADLPVTQLILNLSKSHETVLNCQRVEALACFSLSRENTPPPPSWGPSCARGIAVCFALMDLSADLPGCPTVAPAFWSRPYCSV